VPPMWKVRIVSLRARLADRLRRDHTDRFAALNQTPGRKVRP